VIRKDKISSDLKLLSAVSMQDNLGSICCFRYSLIPVFDFEVNPVFRWQASWDVPDYRRVIALPVSTDWY